MNIKHRLLHALAAAFIAAASCAVHAETVVRHEIVRPEGARSYLLFSPVKQGSEKSALVIMLHGHTGSADLVFGRGKIADPASTWLDIAEREKIVVIAPDGWKGADGKQGWNDCRADTSTNPQTDDVGFIRALIDKSIAEYGVDPSRIYVMGMSNGGAMVYRLATEIGPRLAAVAVMSGPIAAKSLCQPPTHSISLIATYGTDDSLVPYAGGEIGSRFLHGRGSGLGVEAALETWRNLAGLDAAPKIDEVPHREASDSTSATWYTWGQDPSRLQVKFLKIQHGGHTQPSISRPLQWIVTALLGKQNHDVEFTEEAWKFFKDKRAGLHADEKRQGE